VNFLIFYCSGIVSNEKTTSATMVEQQQQEQSAPTTSSSSSSSSSLEKKGEKLRLLRLRLERMKICNDNASNRIVGLFRTLVLLKKYKRIRHGFILIQAIVRGKQSRQLNIVIIVGMHRCSPQYYSCTGCIVYV
jgi:hypothetical protein